MLPRFQSAHSSPESEFKLEKSETAKKSLKKGLILHISYHSNQWRILKIHVMYIIDISELLGFYSLVWLSDPTFGSDFIFLILKLSCSKQYVSLKKNEKVKISGK